MKAWRERDDDDADVEHEEQNVAADDQEPTQKESTATAVSAKLKRMIHRSPIGGDGVIHRAAQPSRDQPLFDKLKSLGSAKPDKAVDNILDGAATLKPIIMSGVFDGLPGYSTIIGQLQVPNMCRDNVPVLAKAKDLKAAGFKIEFEKTKNTAPKYDVDFAAIDPTSGEVTAFAVKNFENLSGTSFRSNLFNAGNQLKNFADCQVKAVHLASRDGKETLAQLRAAKAKDIADFQALYPDYKLTIQMSDGVGP